MIVVFILSTLWWRRIKGLRKLPGGRDWLRRKLGLVLMGRALLTLLHSVPPALLQDIVDPCLCWRLLDTQGKSGSLSCGVTDPFSWVLVHTRFCLCPPRVCFPVLCKFWRLYGGVNGDLLQEGLCHTQGRCPQSPPTVAVHCWPGPLQEMLKHSSVSVPL